MSDENMLLRATFAGCLSRQPVDGLSSSLILKDSSIEQFSHPDNALKSAESLSDEIRTRGLQAGILNFTVPAWENTPPAFFGLSVWRMLARVLPKEGSEEDMPSFPSTYSLEVREQLHGKEISDLGSLVFREYFLRNVSTFGLFHPDAARALVANSLPGSHVVLLRGEEIVGHALIRTGSALTPFHTARGIQCALDAYVVASNLDSKIRSAFHSCVSRILDSQTHPVTLGVLASNNKAIAVFQRMGFGLEFAWRFTKDRGIGT